MPRTQRTGFGTSSGTTSTRDGHRVAGRLTAVLAAIFAGLLVLAGCGSDGDPEVELEGASTESVTPDGGDAGGGGDEIEPDQGGRGQVSINVASLPFGGAAVPVGELGQCATVGWNGDVAVPDGAVLRISVQLTSDLLVLDPLGCLQIDGPWCEGWEVTGVPGGCNIGVIATRAPLEGEAPPSALMSGELVCEEAVAAQCEQTAQALAGSVTTVQFALPEIPIEPDLGPEPETEGTE